MNVWKWLSGRRGAISKSGAVAAMATAGFVGLNFYGYMTDTPKAQEQQVRSLSVIMAQGGELPREYSSIQVRGNGRLATAEERAVFEGNMSFDAVVSQEAAIDALQAPGMSRAPGVTGTALGEGEAGLGMGRNAARVLGPDGSAAPGGAPATGAAGVDKAVASRDGTKINKLGDAPQGGLQRASMARVSGGNGGGFSASTMGASRAEGQSRTGASSLSGAMPGGSMLVSASGALQGARSASYVPGSREARVHGNGTMGQMGSLRGIAHASSKVAANANRSDNEGAQVFMGGERLSGGVEVTGDGVVDTELGGSSYVDDGELADKLKTSEEALDNLDLKEAQREAERTALAKQLISLLFSTITAMITIAALKKTNTWLSLALAGVITAGMAVTIGMFFAKAVKYHNAWGPKDGVAWMCYIAAALFATGIGMAWVNGVSNWINKIMDKVYSLLGMGGSATPAVQSGSEMGLNTLESPGLSVGGINPPTNPMA